MFTATVTKTCPILWTLDTEFTVTTCWVSCLQVNICSDVAECGQGMAGCEQVDGAPYSPVGTEKTLQYSTDGLLQLTYKGPLDDPTGDHRLRSDIRHNISNSSLISFYLL